MQILIKSHCSIRHKDFQTRKITSVKKGHFMMIEDLNSPTRFNNPK